MDHDAHLASVTDRTMALARKIVSRHAADADLRAEDALVDAGLSSLDLVNLMIAVESEFDILIPPSQLNAKTFYSARSISRMVVSVQSGLDSPPA